MTSTTNLCPAKVFQQIQDHGIADDSLVVVPKDILPGQHTAQGDINIHKLESVPVEAIAVVPNNQLAPGTTRGSRHCIKQEDMANCEFFTFNDASPLEGPIIRSSKPFTIEHPEHGDQLWPVGVVAITYQRMHAEEERRIAD